MISGFFRKDLLEKIESLEAAAAELEKENEKLRKRLSKREEKKESEPARFQETAEELKKAKTAIEALEERILSLTEEKGENEKKSSLQNHYLSKKQSLELLEKISSLRTARKSLVSVYLLPDDVESINSLKDELGDEISGFTESIRSETGVIGFFDADIPSICSFFAAPPFPPEKSEIIRDNRFATSPAEEIFTKQRHCAFILAHAGESCIGIATESGLIKSDLIRSSVKEKHSKGGWSQKRFERLREEDIRHHTIKAGEFFSGLLDEYKGITDEIVISGDKKTGFDIAGNAESAGEIAGQQNILKIYRQFDTKPDRYAGEKLAKELWSARWYKI